LKKLNQDKLGMYYAYPWSFIEPLDANSYHFFYLVGKQKAL